MNTVVKHRTEENSVLVRLARKYGSDEKTLLQTLKDTAFRQKEGPEVTDSQMAALLFVAESYGLNPFTKEIYAFPDKRNGVIPVVSVDGWSRLINDNPQFDGLEFTQSENMIEGSEHKPCPEWMEVTIYRKDRSHPIRVREYFDEVYRAPFKSKDGYTVSGPWQTHPKRFLRHKTFIQGGRLAFGFGGIYDEDEAFRIRDSHTEPVPVQGTTRAEQARAALTATAGPPLAPSPVIEPEQVPQKMEPVIEGENEQSQQQTEPVPAASIYDDLLQRGMKMLALSKTKADLHKNWDAVIDMYDDAQVEIPAELETKYNSLAASLKK